MIRDHTIKFIKRMAKRIKKETGIPHHEALNLAAQEAGANNWKHFLSMKKKEERND